MPDSELAREPAANSPALGEFAWFCVRSQLKHEHIAASNLRQIEKLEVFNPRIRYRRSTRRGPVWFTESLFPGYLFARFDWHLSLRQVHHTYGVAGIVHFGERWPTIPEQAIADLKLAVGPEELRLVESLPEVGEEVQISGGAFHGLQGLVQRLIPSRQRVAVLLDFLGRQATVEVNLQEIVRLPSDEKLVRLRHQST